MRENPGHVRGKSLKPCREIPLTTGPEREILENVRINEAAARGIPTVGGHGSPRPTMAWPGWSLLRSGEGSPNRLVLPVGPQKSGLQGEAHDFAPSVQAQFRLGAGEVAFHGLGTEKHLLARLPGR